MRARTEAHTKKSMNSYSKRIMPCAACKLLRRRCTKDCLFLPFFPPTEPEKFAAVHRIFGASNISRMLQEVPVSDRGDAVTSLVYEARARLQEPVYGCVALIASLQKQVSQLQSQLDEVLAEKMTLRTQLSSAVSLTAAPQNLPLTYITEKSNHHEYNQQLQPSENVNSCASRDAATFSGERQPHRTMTITNQPNSKQTPSHPHHLGVGARTQYPLYM